VEPDFDSVEIHVETGPRWGRFKPPEVPAAVPGAGRHDWPAGSVLAEEPREVSGAVDEGDELDEVGLHAIDEAISLDEELAELRVLELGDDAAARGHRRQGVGGFEYVEKEADGGVGGVLGDVRDCFVEDRVRRVGSDYASRFSHLRRSSALTCSCGS
jgi:hypothetical protein